MSTPTTPARPNWLVKLAGDPTPRPLDTPEAVLEGVREGDWEPSDEVRGPGERLWRPIEEHPTFADAVAEMGPPPVEPEDETRLDMNPLIDVALVLLIFFILTATVSTLRRTIDVPPPAPDDAATSLPTPDQIKDRAFDVVVVLDERGDPVVTLAGETILFADLDKKLKEVVNSTGKKEMFLKLADAVLWDTEVKVRSSAADAGVRMIHMPSPRK